MSEIIYETYSRKSEEPDDRQILSLSAQLRECGERFSDLRNVSELEESRSARHPGRPVFNALIKRIERGQTQGIIAWHPDRLSRNGLDTGRIIHLLDIGKLKDLKFVSYTFENTPEGKWMLSMVMGQAKYQVDKQSVDVKRGNREKYEQGGITWRAMQGYQNNTTEKAIEPDPERFHLVRKMWDLLLTGVYSVPEIRRIVTVEWGYLTRRHGEKCGDRPIALSALYLMFRNPLYAGQNIRPDGTVYPTNHEPMISVEEYWRAQQILGKRGRPKPRHHHAPFAGSFIRCAECGCSVTVDHRRKVNKNGTIRHFEYYRCTKKRGSCSQSAIRTRDLEDQAANLLDRITLSKGLLAWTTRYLKERAAKESRVETQIVRQQNRTLEVVDKELRNLAVMRRKDQLEESEYLEQRAELLAERSTFTKRVTETESASWLTPALKVLDFSSACLLRFWKGTAEERRLIVETVAGSHHAMLDGKVDFKPVGVFELLANRPQYATWSSFAEDIHTHFVEHPHETALPELNLVSRKAPEAGSLIVDDSHRYGKGLNAAREVSRQLSPDRDTIGERSGGSSRLAS